MDLPSVNTSAVQSGTRFALLLTSLLLTTFSLGAVFSEVDLLDRMNFGLLAEFGGVRVAGNFTFAAERLRMVTVINNMSNEMGQMSSERASLLQANSHLKEQLSRLPVGGVVVQGGASRPGWGRNGSSATSSPPLFGHVHIAKTSGTSLNGNMSLHFERVCGNKGYSYNAYQSNPRRAVWGVGRWVACTCKRSGSKIATG